jgi:hypothetical protein
MAAWELTELEPAVLFERSNAVRRSQPVKLRAILENLEKLLAPLAAVAFLVAAALAGTAELPASVEAAEQRAPEDALTKWENVCAEGGSGCFASERGPIWPMPGSTDISEFTGGIRMNGTARTTGA